MTSSTRIAIVGAGGISRAHLAAARALNGKVIITAVVEPRDEARQAFIEASPQTTGFASIDAFFAAGADSIADAVMICTPPNARIEIVEKSLAAGLAVFAEKPLANTLASAQKLTALAQQYPKRPTVMGYCHRFESAIVLMRKLAAASELGDVLRFENTFASWHPTMEQSWMSDPQISGGGSFIDTGCHSLDLFRYLIVGDAEVIASTVHHAWPGRAESNATVMLRAAAGARHSKCVGIIQAGWAEPARFEVRLTGTLASLYYNYDMPAALVLVPSRGERTVLNVGSHVDRFTDQLGAFADRVAGRETSVEPASFEDGLAIAQLVDDAARVRQII